MSKCPASSNSVQWGWVWSSGWSLVGVCHCWWVTKEYESSWIFEPCLTCSNALRRVQNPSFSLVARGRPAPRREAPRRGYGRRRRTSPSASPSAWLASYRVLGGATRYCQGTRRGARPPSRGRKAFGNQADPPEGRCCRALQVHARRPFEPATARSAVSHHPSPPVLLIPLRPRWSWSMAMSLVRVGHPSPSVTCGLVAMWSQFRAIVARLGVWRQVTELAARRHVWCQWPATSKSCVVGRAAGCGVSEG